LNRHLALRIVDDLHTRDGKLFPVGLDLVEPHSSRRIGKDKSSTEHVKVGGGLLPGETKAEAVDSLGKVGHRELVDLGAARMHIRHLLHGPEETGLMAEVLLVGRAALSKWLWLGHVLLFGW